MSPSRLKKLKRVYRAAKAFIKAEWEFRYGKHAYEPGPTKEFLRAERKLRKSVTGHSSP